MQNRFIDLYSDTKTKPSPGMRKAMADAYPRMSTRTKRLVLIAAATLAAATFSPAIRVRVLGIRRAGRCWSHSSTSGG
jgi:hypothetical protein